MQGWTFNDWLMLILPFLVGLCLGLLMCTGGKWKRRYKEESRLRTEERKRLDELERTHKHHEAELIAARARGGDTSPRT